MDMSNFGNIPERGSASQSMIMEESKDNSQNISLDAELQRATTF